MQKKESITEKKSFTTSLSEWSNNITNLVARDYEICGIKFDEYSKKCAMEAMTNIYNLVKSSGKAMNNLDTSNLRTIVERCASLKLNANAYPRECYFQLRNVKIGKDEQGRDVWGKQLEMGIEGAGNDAILTNFGRDVAKVYPYWVIKEGDEYIPPRRIGIEITPPEWEERGISQKAVRVVYPIKLTDGTEVYLISDRESVKVNLFAHIKQNLMNETFGICEDRFKATKKQLDEIATKKEEIYSALRACETVDEMLSCEAAKPYMSGAWLDTPESMIVRKMCNNATKKFPKNYNSIAHRAFIEIDEDYQQVQDDIVQNANTIEFVEPNEIIDAYAEIKNDR